MNFIKNIYVYAILKYFTTTKEFFLGIQNSIKSILYPFVQHSKYDSKCGVSFKVIRLMQAWQLRQGVAKLAWI